MSCQWNLQLAGEKAAMWQIHFGTLDVLALAMYATQVMFLVYVLYISWFDFSA